MRWVILGLMVAGTVSAQGQRVEEFSDIAIGFKGGAYWSKDPLTGDRDGQATWQLEAVGPRWFGQRVSLTGSVILPYEYDRSFGSTSQVGEVTFIEDSDDHFESYDLRFGVLYWLRPAGALRPYVGAGVGYFHFDRQVETAVTATQFDPVLGRDVTTVVEERTDLDDEGSEVYPWVSLGTEILLQDFLSAVVEAQYDWAKTYRGQHLGGLAVVVGLRWRF